ncbi:hypothetical protein that often co-occurs with aconitase [hydrothermal vent metagenome]|uniref:DUF1223 domain-containing protein n=1 Tax=hydrothermal vent metagenome TaxID=652676 RepID=A0A3B0U9K6_9ZZZZ
MKNRVLLLLVLVIGVFSNIGVALSEEIKTRPKAVVELFTSQGCSACPPADEIFLELTGRSDILALSYHVDYWDYIGWVDTFGNPENSDLQRSYAASLGNARVYTPQMVINGAMDVVGSRRDEVESGIDAGNLPVIVDLSYSGGLLEVKIPGNLSGNESVVYLVTFRSRAEVAIMRGENRGKFITYAQIVTSRQIIGMWDPQKGAQLVLPMVELLDGDNDGVVIMVQQQTDGNPGPILGASLFQM